MVRIAYCCPYTTVWGALGLLEEAKTRVMPKRVMTSLYFTLRSSNLVPNSNALTCGSVQLHDEIQHGIHENGSFM